MQHSHQHDKGENGRVNGWIGSVACFCGNMATALEDPFDKARMLTWKRATQHKTTGVNIIPNYNKKRHTFEFKVRAYVSMMTGTTR